MVNDRNEKNRIRWFVLRAAIAAVFCAAAVALIPGPAEAQAKKDKKEEPVVTQLDNGLKVIVIPTKRHSVVVTAMIYKIGTGDDMPGKAGLAHLISRVVPYAASQDYKEGTGLAALQKVGFQKNAEKDVGARVFRDATCYYSILNSDKVELALKIEAERVTGLMFAPELVKREALKAAEIVHAQMLEPDNAMLARVLGLVFTVHPYRFPVLGFERDITTIGIDQARGHYDTFYMSNSATLVVIGKVDPESVVKLVTKYYGSFPAGALVETVRKEEPPQTGGRSTVLRFDIPSERIMLGYAGAALASKLQAALLVVGDYLNDELKKRLVDGGKATEVSVSYDWLNNDPGPFIIKVVMPEGKEHLEALELIHATIGEIGEKGIEEKLLADYKARQLKNVTAMLRPELASLAGKKDEYAEALLQGAINIGLREILIGHRTDAFLGFFNALTNDDIETAVATYLDKKRSNLVVLISDK